MTERRRASKGTRGSPTSPGRAKFATKVDPAILAGVREIAKRKGVRICDVSEMALLSYIQGDAAGRTDAHLSPLIDRVMETRLKYLEGGLRKMIARLAYENLAITYILCNFIVEANVPAGKVEKWRVDGRKFAVQEFRKRRNEYEDSPEDEDQ
ncbi:MAG TPA: hypothetical protein VD973_06535 [Symbiobacteriaceae bacterium]|nr:hypothetical protein [Symbiobacteriaceae bacterium]